MGISEISPFSSSMENGIKNDNSGIFADLNEVPIDLYEPTNNEVPRYTIHILDQKPHRENGKYAAFIVPQGRLVKLIFPFRFSFHF